MQNKFQEVMSFLQFEIVDGRVICLYRCSTGPTQALGCDTDIKTFIPFTTIAQHFLEKVEVLKFPVVGSGMIAFFVRATWKLCFTTHGGRRLFCQCGNPLSFYHSKTLKNMTKSAN